jgi:DNA polymerase III subunit delta
MYFDDFLNRIKKEEGPNLVLLFGDSESVIAEGYRVLKDKFRKSKPGGTIQVFDGTQDDLMTALSAAQTTGLFSTSQLLAFKNAEKVLGGRSESAVQQLKDYFENPNPDSCLVFMAPGMRKTAKAVTAVERLGWAVQCGDMPEWKLTAWVRQQAQGMGLGMGDEAAQLLVQKIGPDIAYLQRALEQLADFVFPQKTVSTDQVRGMPVPGVESEIFPFLDAVGSRQTEKALGLMGRLEEGVDTGTLMMLYGRTRELLLIALGRAKGWSQPLLAEKLGLHPFRLKNLWEQSSQFTVEELKGALADLIHLQAGVVTGRLGKNTPTISLEWWVLKWGKNRMAKKEATR